MKVIEISVVFYWAKIIVAISTHQDAANNVIEVYQMIPMSKTIVLDDDTEVELSLDSNFIKFPSGITCKYSTGRCYDNEIRKWHHWEVGQNSPIHDILCRNLVRIYNTSYDRNVLKIRRDPLIAFQNGSSVIAIRLIKEGKVCGGKLWRTNNSELFVAIKRGHFVPNKSEVPLIYDSPPYLVDNKGNPETLISLQKELNELKEENARLKEEISSIQSQLNNLELHRISKRSEDEFSGPLDSVCSNFVLFPCENILSIVVIISYITFSIINTVMNYSSLRMLRIKTDRTIVFYCLTQGLTTRYICRTMGATKMKVDKWFLDIEHPLHDFK